MAIFICPCAYSKTKSEKKRPVGANMNGRAKVWNSEDGVVKTDDDSVKPVEEQKYKTGVFGAEQVDNYIMPGTFKKVGDKYHYVLDTGNAVTNTWVNIDMDDDGLYEYCYFGPNGDMVVNTNTVDGYRVNSSGVWIDNDGNVKKLFGVVVDKIISKKDINANEVKKEYDAERLENLDKSLNAYFDTVGNDKYVSKYDFRRFLKEKKCTDTEIENVISSINWTNFALDNLIKYLNKKDINDIATKTKAETMLRTNGFTSEEIEGAMANCGVADWNKITDDMVRDILANSVGKLSVRFVENIVKRGLTESEVLESLSRIKGKTITMSDLYVDEE